MRPQWLSSFGVYLWGVDLVLTSIVGWIYRTLGAA
jgi:hypothetical protein